MQMSDFCLKHGVSTSAVHVLPVVWSKLPKTPHRLILPVSNGQTAKEKGRFMHGIILYLKIKQNEKGELEILSNCCTLVSSTALNAVPDINK